jgi:hypothetical protein
VNLNINWGLFDSNVNVAAAVQQGMREGQAFRARQMAMKREQDEHEYQQAERARAGEARSALSGYLLSGSRQAQPSAFEGGDPLSTPATPVQVGMSEGVVRRDMPPASTLSDRMEGGRPLGSAAAPAFTPLSPTPGTNGLLAMIGDGQVPGAAPAAALPVNGLMPSMMGRPMPQRSRAARLPEPEAGNPDWERYVRADPSGAMKTMLGRHELTKAQNEAMVTQMDLIGRLARGAVDQPSYEAALQQAQGMGLDTSSLPPQFDPAAVNAIELQALSAKEYLTEQRNDRRLEWDIEDDQIDNTRDDRSVESQVDYREGQLDNTRRGQDLTDARGRRGQDLSSGDRRRGQNLSSADRQRGQTLTDARGRRGQDMTDVRVRRGQDMGGGRARGARGRGGGSTARAVGPDGRAIVLRGGKWVDEVTGRPVS